MLTFFAPIWNYFTYVHMPVCVSFNLLIDDTRNTYISFSSKYFHTVTILTRSSYFIPCWTKCTYFRTSYTYVWAVPTVPRVRFRRMPWGPFSTDWEPPSPCRNPPREGGAWEVEVVGAGGSRESQIRILFSFIAVSNVENFILLTWIRTWLYYPNWIEEVGGHREVSPFFPVI